MHGNPDLKVPDNTDGIYIYIYMCVSRVHMGSIGWLQHI